MEPKNNLMLSKKAISVEMDMAAGPNPVVCFLAPVRAQNYAQAALRSESMAVRQVPDNQP